MEHFESFTAKNAATGGMEEAEGIFSKISSKPKFYLESYSDLVSSEYKKIKISKGALCNLRPYENEKFGFKIGKEIKKIPKNLKNIHVYYHDDSDRILLIDAYGSTKSPKKTFYFYHENEIISVTFDGAGDVSNVIYSSIENGLLRQDNNFGVYGCSISDYQYDNYLLKKIIVLQKEHGNAEFSNYDIFFQHNNEQLEKVFYLFPNGYQEQYFP